MIISIQFEAKITPQIFEITKWVKWMKWPLIFYILSHLTQSYSIYLCKGVRAGWAGWAFAHPLFGQGYTVVHSLLTHFWQNSFLAYPLFTCFWRHASRVYQTRAWPQATHEAPTGDRCKAGPISQVHMKVLIYIRKYVRKIAKIRRFLSG